MEISPGAFMPGLVCSKEVPKAEGDVMGLSCPPHDAGWQGSVGGTPALMGRKGMENGGRERKLCASDSCPFPEPSLNLHPPSITRDVQCHSIFISAFPHLFHPPHKIRTEAPQLFHEKSLFRSWTALSGQQ